MGGRGSSSGGAAAGGSGAANGGKNVQIDEKQKTISDERPDFYVPGVEYEVERRDHSFLNEWQEWHKPKVSQKGLDKMNNDLRRENIDPITKSAHELNSGDEDDRFSEIRAKTKQYIATTKSGSKIEAQLNRWGLSSKVQYRESEGYQ